MRGWVIEMIQALTSLLWFLTVSFDLVMAQSLRPNAAQDTLTTAGEAVESVLITVSQPHCSVFLFTDGNTFTSTIFTELSHFQALGGMVVFEVLMNDRDSNKTTIQLSRMVTEARE
ncbi:putative olfactory ionotropic receptor IR4-like 10, partial [Homarus americanus]